MIFQLGTNNWQRPCKDDPSTLEFAPGSGVLHEAHHIAMNQMDGMRCYSMYPSKNQGQPSPDADYRVFELQHDIPICESASPNSSYRWHSMSEEEFATYTKRLEDEVYAFMKECEAKEGSTFSAVIAHHSFVNPVVMQAVIQRRMADGLPQIPLYCFVHGTALKMYKWELGKTNEKEYPLRFHKWVDDKKMFSDPKNCVNACFVISADQKKVLQEVWKDFPADRIIVVPNGINMETFCPQPKTLPQVLKEQLIDAPILWPATKPTEETIGGYKKMITFVGKFAEWKRQAALHMACAELEKQFPDFCALFVGAGPDEDRDKLIACCEKLGVKNTYLCGARGQPVLAEIYTVADLGCFPSFKEPFGLVFVECMACKTPVIGAKSGGPIDFVTDPVGHLCDEPPETTSLDTVPAGIETLAKSLKEAIAKALTEDWKKTKGEACLQLALDRFTVKFQVTNMFDGVKKLSSA